LHNNAGITALGNATELAIEDWNRVIATNLTGAFLCSRFAIPQMKKRGGGVIINMASTQAFGNRPNAIAYGASKAAIISLTRSLALDHGRDGIRAVAVAPGPVDTAMLRRAAQVASPGEPDAAMRAWADGQPSGRVATAEDVAQTVLFLASSAAAYVTGSALVVDGGMLAGLS
jgi:NAD(P)-dependent dehydrogenase (short-subunit alcohol dehydrogenase family)